MSSVITLSSGSEDEANNFQDASSRVTPVLSTNRRLHPCVTITKKSPKEKEKKEKDKILVKSLSKPKQNQLDFNNLKRKYSYDSKNNINKKKDDSNSAFARLCKRNKSMGTPELVDIELENEKPGLGSQNGIPKIADVKSLAPKEETKKKSITDLICSIAGHTLGAQASTQINQQKTKTPEKESLTEKKNNVDLTNSTPVLNPFSSALKKSPPPLRSICKKPKSEHKSSVNHFKPFSSETKKTNNLSSFNKFQQKANSDKNFNNLSENKNVKKDVEIVSLEVDDREDIVVEKKEAVVEDKPKSKEEKQKRKRDENTEQEEKVKKKKDVSSEPEEKVKKKKDVCSEPEEKPKRSKSCSKAAETFEKFKILIKSEKNGEKNDEDRERIIMKLNKHFNSSDPSYVQSEEFNSLLEKSIKELKEEPFKLYHVLKEVFENLKSRKVMKLAKKKVAPLPVEIDRKDILKDFIEPEEYLPAPVIKKKNAKRVEKCLKTMKKLKKKVKELEEAEVDLDDEENSSYFRMQKYRERLCLIHKKYSELINESPDAGRTVKTKICFSGTKIPSVNKCIERWLNKTKQFPDFVDILKLITQQNETESLGMTPDKIKTVAEIAFREVGETLRRRRQYDLYDIHLGYFDEMKDPADLDPELNATLENNRKEYSKKIEEIMTMYVNKQGNAKGEVVEDDEAERSVESDDEDEKEIEEVEKALKYDTSDEEEVEEEDNEKSLQNGDEDIQALSPSPGEMDELPSSPTSENFKTGEATLTTPPVKESKNNYKHCKSLKWRPENSSKCKSDLCNDNDKSVSDSKTENNLNCLTNDKKCEEDLSADLNIKLVEDDKPKIDLDKNDSMKDLDCEIIEASPPKNNWIKDNHMRKSSFLVNYVTVEHSFKSHENFNKKFKYKKIRDKTLGFALNDLTNLNSFDACKERGRRNFKFFTKKSHKENLNPMAKANYKFFNQDKVFKLGCKKRRDEGYYCTLESKDNEVRVNGGDNGKGEEREIEREEEGNGEENENLNGGNGDGNNNNDDGGDDERRREKSGDEENEEEEEEEEEEEDCANGNYDAETDGESQSSKDECKEGVEERGMDESSGEKEEEMVGGEMEEPAMEGEVEGGGEEEDEMNEEVKEAEEERVDEEEGGMNEESEKPMKEAEEEEEMAEEGVEEAEEKLEEHGKMTEEEAEDEIGEKLKEDVKEEENSGEESNCSAGTEQGEVKEGDDVTEKADISVKIEVKKEEEGDERVEEEEEGKTDDKLEVKTEESIQDNEKSVEPKNETEEMGETEEPVKENEEAIGENEKAIEENGENEATNDDINDTKEEDQEATYEIDQEEAGPSTSKRKDYTDAGNSSDIEVIDVKKPKFTSDEELVKNFLKHSPSSISITPPRKSQYSKPPSAEALQALATLRQLKNISTTRVRRRRNENGDVVVIRDPPQRERNNFVNNVPTSTPRVRYQIPQNRNRGGLPVISNVQSINRNRQSNNLTPKIVTVQGNVSNFYNRSNNIGFPYRMNNVNNVNNMNHMIPGFNHFPQFNNQFNNFSMFNNRQPQSSLKISNVRGNISFGPQPQLQRRFVNPTTSFRQTAPSSSTGAKDKDKKPVEYVVLD